MSKEQEKNEAGESPEKLLPEVIRRDGRYPMDAFAFLHEGLERAVKEVHGQRGSPAKPRHVSAQQMCVALRNEAVERWGLLAKTVLARWNIHGTLDFGNMVYLLVNNNLWQKTEEDSLDDFRDVYDFDKVFSEAAIFEVDS